MTHAYPLNTGQCPECGALAYLDSKALEDDAAAQRNTAARAMLAALREAISLLENGDTPETWQAGVKQGRAAIAQAEACGIESAK